jgi:hypothetical protein
MNEDQWLACTDAQQMLDWLRNKGMLTERKARLFAVACCRRIWPLLEERGRRAVEFAEQYADASATGERLNAARQEALQWYEVCQTFATFDPFDDGTVAAAEAMALAVDVAQAGLVGCAPERVVAATVLSTTKYGSWKERQFSSGWSEAKSAAQDAMRRELSGLLRDVIGHFPFRQVRIDPACLAWNDGTVRKQAEAIYEERALPAGTLDDRRLSVLADALEEAGCGEPDVLGHCRQQGRQHVRGCWVVDLLLGKE